LNHTPKRIAQELKMQEKDLYPAVEHFLKIKKNCLPEYVGTELSLKSGKTNHRMADILEDIICFTEARMRKGSEDKKSGAVEIIEE